VHYDSDVSSSAVVGAAVRETSDESTPTAHVG